MDHAWLGQPWCSMCVRLVRVVGVHVSRVELAMLLSQALKHLTPEGGTELLL